MKPILFCIAFFFLFCKPDPLPKYESYLYKPVSSRNISQPADVADFIKKIETENSLDFTKNKNPTAYIPPMCYTKTTDSSGKAHNPCYACHTKGEKPNFLDDSDLQTHYEFPKVGKINPWKNLFTFKNADSYSDAQIETYIREDNYKDDKGEIILSKNLPANWGGYVPDCYFHFDEEGFDKNPKTGEYSGWRAYRYYPFLGTFWATNGSTDDVLIRLPFPFRADKNRKPNLEIYKTNLAIVEALLKQKTIQTETMRYAGMAEEYQNSKELLIAGGLFPVGTEFLHSVRYLDWNKEANTVMLSARMKELRYARKNEWYNYSELKDKVSREKKDLRFRTEKTPEGFHGDYEHGFDNKMGWVYQGFIEDKKGNLRPQTNEETLFCMGCHSSLGVLADSTFSFSRKMEGTDRLSVDYGWGHWSSKDISGVADRLVSFKNFGDQDEYSFYLQNNRAGDEFRENEEIKKIFFQKDGTLNHEAFTKLKSDVGILINPSRERSILLNKSYRAIVQSQSFRFGRDAILKKPTNVFEKIPDGQTTGIEKIIF